MSQSDFYWFILFLQFFFYILLPYLYLPKDKQMLFHRALKFLPIALIVGFVWDNILGYFDVWKWGKDITLFIFYIPIQDIVFIIEIYLIAVMLTIVFSK